MAGNRTVPTGEQVEHFVNSVADDSKRRDSWDMIALMREIISDSVACMRDKYDCK